MGTGSAHRGRNPAQHAATRDVLAAELDRTDERVAGLTRELEAIVESAELANVDDEHDPEGSTIGFERAQVAALLNDATSRRADLERAVDRVRDGTYGRCERCEEPIPSERLEAAPFTEMCIRCATETQRARHRGRDARA